MEQAIHGAPPPAPYARRRFGSLGLWEGGGFALKAYAINKDTEPALPLLPGNVAGAARAHVAGRLDAARAEGGHYGLGYVVLHRGEEANWLLLDWWIEGGIGCQLLSSSTAAAPTRFEPVARPFVACVWELVVVGHERYAWVRHMLKADPDPLGYLNDRMDDGLH